MTDRVHIRNGQIIRKYTGEKGRIQLENGGIVMPVVIGFANGNDKVVPYLVVTNDTSTGPDIITTKNTVVNAEDVTETITIRDKTTQEMVDELDATQEDVLTQLDRSNNIIKALGGIIFKHENDIRTLTAQTAITIAEFKSYVKSKL